MVQLRLLLLCAAFALPLVSTQNPSDEPKHPVTLPEKMKIIRDVLQKYDQDLDRTVPFKELKSAIQGLDIMARNYSGVCLGDINTAATLGVSSTDNYVISTNNIVRWCSNAEAVFSFILENQDDVEESKIEKLVHKMLNKGLVSMKQSINKLGVVVDQLSQMEITLRPVPEKLTKELTEKRLQYEKEQKEAEERKEEKKTLLDGAMSAASSLVGFVIAHFTGKDGGIISAKIKESLSGVPAVVLDGSKDPSLEERIKVTEAYYTSILDVVKQAHVNVTDVRYALQKQLKFVDLDLQENVPSVENGSLKSQILEELRKFMPVIEEMLGRHLPSIKPPNSPRTRRDLEYVKSIPFRYAMSTQTTIEYLDV